MTLQSFDASEYDRSREFLLDRRGERLHPKRHRTLGRAKRRNAKKRSRIKHRLSVLAAAKSRYHTAVEAYWAGERDGHP